MSRDSAFCCAVVVTANVPTTATTAATVRCQVLMSLLLRALNRGISPQSQAANVLESARLRGESMISHAFKTFLLGALLALPATAFAQEATLSGTIVDSTNSVLPGVTVTAVHQ